MSDWKGHLKTGLIWETIILVICLLAVFNGHYTISISEYLLILTMMIIAPLFPDIDHRSSIITVRIILFSTIALWVTYFFYTPVHLTIMIILSITVLMSNFAKHRGITHKWWFLLIINIIIYYFSLMIVLAIVSFVGMLSHLYMDQ